MNNLEVYDKLRSMHCILHEITQTYKCHMTPIKTNAIDAIESVLYLTEGVFSTDGDLDSDLDWWDIQRAKAKRQKLLKGKNP